MGLLKRKDNTAPTRLDATTTDPAALTRVVSSRARHVATSVEKEHSRLVVACGSPLPPRPVLALGA